MHFVFVGRPNAATRGSDFGPTGSVLGGEFDHAVVGQDDLGSVGNEELTVDRQESHRVKHDTIADHSLALRPEDTTGDELQDELATADDDGVPGIVAAGVARNHIEAFRQNVNDFAFALVTPLGTENYRGWAFGHEGSRLRSWALAA